MIFKHRSTYALLLVLVLLTMGEASVIVGPAYEDYIWPISHARPLDITRKDHIVRFNQEIDKLRDCTVLSGRYYISQLQTSVQAEVTVINEFQVPVGTVNRPLGKGIYGPYRFMLPALGFDGPFYLRGVFIESCHPGWSTIHRLGPFEFPGQ